MVNMFHLPCIYQSQNIWKATDALQHLWRILFTIYDVFHSQHMMYFIHNIWCILFTIYDVFIHNIWSFLFTIYDVFYSQSIMHFIHNVLCILFTIYFIHNTVNKIRHGCCSAIVALLHILNHSISSCSNLFSCSPAVSLHTKTNRQTWKPHRCNFSNFLFEFTVRWDSGIPDQIVGFLWTCKSILSTKSADSLQLDNCTPYSALASTLHASV
jgi:hypothetical protein